MKKVIIFDYWGTLVNTGVASPFKQIKNLLRLEGLDFSIYVHKLEKSFMTKNIKNLEDGFRAVLKDFGINENKFLMEKLVGIWNQNWLFSKAYDETASVLEDLKNSGYTLVLISNTDNISIENSINKFDLKKYFDRIFLSCETNKLKAEMYEMIPKELGVLPSECLMVGDSMESDVNDAKNALIDSVLVDRFNKREFEKKIENLKGLKNMIGGF